MSEAKNQEQNLQVSLEAIEKDGLIVEEAREITNLNEEISSIININDKKTEEVMENLSRPARFITTRGYEVFDYNEMKEEYDNSTPILRDFNLPFCKPLMINHLKFWGIFSPFLGTSIYTGYHLCKYDVYVVR